MGVIKDILDLLHSQRGLDFSGNHAAMLDRRIKKRLFHTKCKTIDEYLQVLYQTPDETDLLIDTLTINVSRFFRNPISFEFIKEYVLPELILAKTKNNEKSLRIWSAGCSRGEEPYSLAILINELFMKENCDLNLNIFATDIDKKALNFALEGSYSIESMSEVKLGIFNKYFVQKDNMYAVKPEIRNKVHFSFHDLLNASTFVPSESIYGGFDIVLCRNVLIYFKLEYQKIILNKLYNSLNANGYLVLGEAETPVADFKQKFIRINSCCKIYRKTTCR